MIRDPSDGSVREAPKPERKQALGFAEKPAGEFSGLPTGSAKASQKERLERSREWLQQYLKSERK